MSQRTGYQPPNPYHVPRASLVEPLEPWAGSWFDRFTKAMRRADYAGARELLAANEPRDVEALAMLGKMIADGK